MTREIKMCVSLSNRALVFNPEYTFDKLLDYSRYLEDNGYYGIFLGDGFQDKPRWDPLLLHVAISMITKRIKLGTATLNIDYRHPLEFAKNWAELDQISKGRTILGIGIGASSGPVSIQHEMELSGNGHLWPIRGTMQFEWIEAMKKLWTNNQASYHGKCFSFDDVYCEPKPYQKPYPPMLIARGYPTVKDSVLAKIAKIADGWMVNGGTTPKTYAETWNKIKVHLKENGKDPDKFETAYQVTGALGEDVEEERKGMIDWIKTYYWRDDTDRLDFWGPVGNADTWIDWLSKCMDAGVKMFIVRLATWKLQERMEKFTKEVLPSFS
jgi:alkanesulfonate monooxygenase SsuD/methylene tetrahydromethanopterin reductase-like flavin-dependent oxidoreductase (luciferase family)